MLDDGRELEGLVFQGNGGGRPSTVPAGHKALPPLERDSGPPGRTAHNDGLCLALEKTCSSLIQASFKNGLSVYLRYISRCFLLQLHGGSLPLPPPCGGG